MRILHVTDLHADSLWFDWVANHCGRYDLLAISGDLLDAFSKVPLVEQVHAVKAWFNTLSAPVVVCSGNHDYWVSMLPDRNTQGLWISDLKRRDRHKRIVAVDGDVAEFGGLRIAVKGWLGENPEGQFDLLVTHAPPSGTPCAASGIHDNGDPNLWDLECTPRWILCGHVHQPRRFECMWPPLDPTTAVLNPGFDGHAEIPNHWVLDTTTNTRIFRGSS
jgi:Icc-related predicted phosphoesterase